MVSAIAYNNAAQEQMDSMIANNLDLVDDTLCDMVFDKDGNVLSITTYEWNSTTNTRGAVISMTH